MGKSFGYTPDIAEELLLEEEIAFGWSVVLYNDDVNTFDWVIECLIKYCKHNPIQAEQCALIVHTKGKCQVKSGDFNILEPICTALCDCGLSAALEQ